mmetsp:Transcript_42294/g.121515  ORF Transcript_42294/g.121515 Transcript_42294/m.121515 type:complete len:359 (-) Transcript_42294:26-1102(-)
MMQYLSCKGTEKRTASLARRRVMFIPRNGGPLGGKNVETPCWALASTHPLEPRHHSTRGRAAWKVGPANWRTPAGVQHAGRRAPGGPCRRPTVSSRRTEGSRDTLKYVDADGHTHYRPTTDSVIASEARTQLARQALLTSNIQRRHGGGGMAKGREKEEGGRGSGGAPHRILYREGGLTGSGESTRAPRPGRERAAARAPAGPGPPPRASSPRSAARSWTGSCSKRESNSPCRGPTAASQRWRRQNLRRARLRPRPRNSQYWAALAWTASESAAPAPAAPPWSRHPRRGPAAARAPKATRSCQSAPWTAPRNAPTASTGSLRRLRPRGRPPRSGRTTARGCLRRRRCWPHRLARSGPA